MSDNIKVSLNDIVASGEALEYLRSVPLPAKSAFRLSKVLRSVDTAVKDFDEQRKALCELHGDLDEKGEKYEIRKDEVEVFNKEFEELTAEKVDIDVAPIPIDSLEKVEISEAHVSALEWLFTE